MEVILRHQESVVETPVSSSSQPTNRRRHHLSESDAVSFQRIAPAVVSALPDALILSSGRVDPFNTDPVYLEPWFPSMFKNCKSIYIAKSKQPRLPALEGAACSRRIAIYTVQSTNSSLKRTPLRTTCNHIGSLSGRLHTV